MASFVSGPEEGSSPFVNGLDNTGGKKPSSHGMGKHGRKNRVY
jgi:hypothetical protein